MRGWREETASLLTEIHKYHANITKAEKKPLEKKQTSEPNSVLAVFTK